MMMKGNLSSSYRIRQSMSVFINRTVRQLDCFVYISYLFVYLFTASVSFTYTHLSKKVEMCRGQASFLSVLFLKFLKELSSYQLISS